MHLKGLPEDLEGRLRHYAPAGSPDECWEWQGGSNFRIRAPGGKVRSAPTAAWEVDRKRDLPYKHRVIQTCRNRLCTNPKHITAPSVDSESGVKFCPSCWSYKDVKEFCGWQKDRNGVGNICRSCNQDSSKRWYADNFEKVRDIKRAEAPRTRDKELQRDYGLSTSGYEELLNAQGGGCAICHRKHGLRRLAVDHDHSCCPGSRRTCGSCVRGILCHICNQRLGWLEDSEWLTAARAYLKSPPAKAVT